MGEVIEIYGTRVTCPDEGTLDTLNEGRPYLEQKWQREELPDYFDQVEISASGDLLLNEVQEQYADRQVTRLKRGIFCWIGGRSRYIPPKYYFFLQYYTLEDGSAPEFREADRLWFLFLQFWEAVLWCLGIVRAKKRRQGASSQACSNLIYEAIFYRNSNCGLVSKTKDDSKDTFTEMVTKAYQCLPVFLKPRQLNKEDSVTELVFAHKAQTQKGGIVKGRNADKGHASKINYRAPVINAYDRSRLSRILIDEGAKFPKDVPTSKLLSIISKTLVKGVKRVGFAELCSTVNEMTRGGGAEYYKIWKQADQRRRKPTVNRLVQFFQPAYEAYEGFIDQFGDSVVDAPTEEQYAYLVEKWVIRDPASGELISELSEEDIRLGARHYVQVKRREGLEGTDLEEEIRMNPCTEDEAFLSAVTDCVFNALKIKERQKQLEDHPVKPRHLLFERGEDGLVRPKDVSPTDSFHWQLTWLPGVGEQNKYKMEAGLRAPGRTADGAITVDSYANSQGGRRYGSKAAAWIGRRANLLDPENTGKAVGFLYGRPQVKETLHEQVLLAAEYYGYRVWYEHTADDYLSYFRDRGKIGYLGRYPTSLIDPTKRADAERYRGTPITPFSLTKQLDNGIVYFNYHCHQIDFVVLLDNALIFDPYDRTAYDAVVAFLILISVLMEPEPVPSRPPAPLIRTYPRSGSGATDHSRAA